MKYITDLYIKSFAGLKKEVWLMAAMMFVNRMGTLIMPFLTLYTTQELGWSIIESGVATTCFGAGGLVGSIIGGWLTDRIGYFKVIFFSLIFGGVAFFSLQYFTDFYWLCGMLLLSSSISDTIRPAVMTGVTMLSGEDTRTRAISMLRMAFNLGFAIGPAIGGLIIAVTSYKWIFILDAITCMAAAVFCYYFVRNSVMSNVHETMVQKAEAKQTNTAKSPYIDFPFMMLMVFSMMMLIPFFQIISTLPLYMKVDLGLGEKFIGAFFAVNGLLIFIFEMPIVHTTETKWKLFPAMALGSLLVGISMIVLYYPILGVIGIFLYSVLVAFGEIISFPFISSVTIRRTNKANIGQYMGIVSMMFSLSVILAPISGTWLVDRYGFATTFLLMGLSSIVSAIGYLWVRNLFLADEARLVALSEG